MRANLFTFLTLAAALTPMAFSQSRPLVSVEQGALTGHHGRPFHLEAVFTEGDDPDFKTSMTLDWVGPRKWTRKLESKEFSQTIVVNGDQVEETASDSYVPLAIEMLLMALTDPTPIFQSALRVFRANGALIDNGIYCINNNPICRRKPTGLAEIVAAPGHIVEFSGYQKFHNQQIARLVIDHPGMGESNIIANVDALTDLKSPREEIFSITQPTAPAEQSRVAMLSEQQLRGLIVAPQEIIWPQPLDGAQTGRESFYVTLDRTGAVREIFPVDTVNERTNESAERQIRQWKFKPAIKDGLPSQAEGLLTFNVDTRKYGPQNPLTDAQARALATNTLDPVLQPGTIPPGSIKLEAIAVDAEGRLIEEIAGEGPSEMTIPCMQALQQWKFKPILEDGQPRPYRATIVCKAP